MCQHMWAWCVICSKIPYQKQRSTVKFGRPSALCSTIFTPKLASVRYECFSLYSLVSLHASPRWSLLWKRRMCTNSHLNQFIIFLSLCDHGLVNPRSKRPLKRLMVLVSLFAVLFPFYLRCQYSKI